MPAQQGWCGTLMPPIQQAVTPAEVRNPSRPQATPSGGQVKVGIPLLEWGGAVGSRDYQATGGLAQSRACVYKTRPLVLTYARADLRCTSTLAQ